MQKDSVFLTVCVGQSIRQPCVASFSLVQPYALGSLAGHLPYVATCIPAFFLANFFMPRLHRLQTAWDEANLMRLGLLQHPYSCIHGQDEREVLLSIKE